MEQEIIQLGEIPQNTIHKFSHSTSKDIKFVHCACGCTTNSYTTRQVNLEFNPGNVPPQILRKGNNSFLTQKSCTITYTDNTKQLIIFKAEVFKNVEQNT